MSIKTGSGLNGGQTNKRILDPNKVKIENKAKRNKEEYKKLIGVEPEGRNVSKERAISKSRLS